MTGSPARLYVPALDGLRALMVFMVSWYHIWQQSWLPPRLALGPVILDFEPYVRSGYLWVDGMILLSGFVLFLPYAQSRLSHGPWPSARGFYQRRFTRVMPSYLFMLAVLLFGAAIPQGLYASPAAMWQDILAHLTFTFTFTPATYLHTPLNMAAWTLGIEMQFYLIFPLLARGMVKRPGLTALAMIETAFLYRLYCTQSLSDLSMVVNQLPSFLDVFALGMLGAWAYTRLQGRPGRFRRFMMLGVALAGLWGAGQLMLHQAHRLGGANIQRWQMILRFPLAVNFLALTLGLSLSFGFVHKVLGNRVFRFAAAISMNYYLWHQRLAVALKAWRLPPYESEMPQKNEGLLWQTQYTLLCFSLAVAAAALITYGIERPAARGLQKIFLPKCKEASHL